MANTWGSESKQRKLEARASHALDAAEVILTLRHKTEWIGKTGLLSGKCGSALNDVPVSGSQFSIWQRPSTHRPKLTRVVS